MGNLCSSGLKHFEDQEYKKIRKQLLSDNELFVDEKFPPSNHLLPTDVRDAVWLRPHEICGRLKGRELDEFGGPVIGERSRLLQFLCYYLSLSVK